MLNKKRTWDLIGIVLGLVILIAGIVFAATPPRAYSTDSTDYASFGGDFYTYQYKATRVVAGNTAVTANNLREIGEAQAMYFGVLFMAAGALTMVSYGKKYFAEDVPEVSAAVPEAIPVPEETIQPEAASELSPAEESIFTEQKEGNNQ